MKTNILSALTIALVAVFSTACSDDAPGNKSRPMTPVQLTDAESRAITSGNDFSIDIFKSVSKSEGTKNMFFSPLAASLNMAMIANGAAGNSRAEILTALGYQGNEAGINDLNSAYSKLIDVLPTTDPRTKMNLATSVWIDKDTPAKDAFVNTCKSIFASDVFTMDTNNPSATIKRINSWCSKKTSGSIPQILDENARIANFYLIDAIDFKGFWAKPFKETTKKGVFTATDGTTYNVDMMHTSERLPYGYDDNFRILGKTFGNGAYSIKFILPTDPDMDLNTALASFNRQTYASINMTYKDIALSAPRLQIDGSYNVIQNFKELGINDIFDPEKANLINLSDFSTYVSTSFQKTTFMMDEKGAEAKAVHTSGMVGTLEPIDHDKFILDRPFIFMITETSSGAIIFMGKVERF